MAWVPTGGSSFQRRQSTPGTSRARPVETLTLRVNPSRSTTYIINQAFMRKRAVSRALFRVLGGVRARRRARRRDRGSGSVCSAQEVVVLLGRWGHGCRRLQPRCGARRFGAWAFIRHAQCGGHGAVRPQQQLGSFTCVDPHRGGVMPDSELAAVAVSEPHAASFRRGSRRLVARRRRG